MSESLPPQIISLRRVPEQAWRNGGGTTRELLTGPVDERGEWRYRISVADIERDGPFSRFESVQRHFCVLTGQGVELEIDGVRHLVQAGDEVVNFLGDSTVKCKLINGATSDLNFMVRHLPTSVNHSGMQRLSSNQPWHLPRVSVSTDFSQMRTGLVSSGVFARLAGQCQWQSDERTLSARLEINDLIWFEHAPDKIVFSPSLSVSLNETVAWGMFVEWPKKITSIESMR
jgi:environmental stress-induced protein Ves